MTYNEGLIIGVVIGTIIGRALWDIGGYLWKKYKNRKS